MPRAQSIRPKDIVLRPEPFRLLKVLPTSAAIVLRRIAAIETPFLFVTREEEALSLLIREQDAKLISEFLQRATAEPTVYRLITFSPSLPWNLVGFMARVTAVLADANIPVGAISSFDRDHVFLRDEFSGRAVDLLRDAARDGRLL